MATNPTNKDKNPIIDESILDETPPNINEPQTSPEEDKSTIPNDEKPIVVEEENNQDEQGLDGKGDTLPEEEIPEDKTLLKETDEQKEQRYKAQQTEAQIQAAKNRDLIDKVDQATKVGDPTPEELRNYVREKGVDWDELTPFEQAMAKDTLIAKKQFGLVNEVVQSTKKIDEWAQKVDAFIDSTDGKPEYKGLSGHEADFRKFVMKESHRGADIESLLLPAFLHNLPTQPRKRNAIFETGGGGEKVEISGKITDADTVANLRATNPREYARLLKAGRINLDV